jgi:hypothetical protein
MPYKGDADARRRLSAEDRLKLEREIIKRRKRGNGIREIGRALNMPPTTVHRVVKRSEDATKHLARNQEQPVSERIRRRVAAREAAGDNYGLHPEDELDREDLDLELDAELGALVARLDGSIHIEDVTSPEQVPMLNKLELWRAEFLEADHPAHAAVAQAVEQGWRWPESPPA